MSNKNNLSWRTILIPFILILIFAPGPAFLIKGLVLIIFEKDLLFWPICFPIGVGITTVFVTLVWIVLLRGGPGKSARIKS